MTIYWLHVRYYHDQKERILDFNSATERALTLIMLMPYAEIVAQGLKEAEVTQ